MKKKIIIGILVTVFVIGGVIFLRNKTNTQVLSSQTSATQTPKIEEELPILEIFENTVEVNSVKAQNGQKIEVGSKIKTDSNGRAQIVYPNNSVTRIDKNSEIVLQEFRVTPSVTKVKIEKGRIWSRIAKLFGKDDSYETQTNTLVASVRGTSFGHGILDDGSNKISVSRSQVKVDCSTGSKNTIEVLTNKKVTTKCQGVLSALNWGGEETGDEWFKWNLAQDNELDKRFGESVYDDKPSPTPKPTLKPTLKPTVKPTASPTPSVKPSATPTLTPSPSLTPSPIASPNLSVIGVKVICAYCADYSTQIEISGTGFYTNSRAFVVGVNDRAKNKIYASSVQVVNSSTIKATFNPSLGGTYYVGVNEVSNEKATFSANIIN